MMYNPYSQENNVMKPGNPYYTTGSTPYYTQPPEEPRKRDQKRKKAPMIIGAVLVIALSGAAGSGGAWLVTNQALKNVSDMQAAAGVVQTVPQTAVSTAASGDIAAVVQQAAASVVEITTEAAIYNPFMGQSVTQGAGSGVILSNDGYIVTNNHVVDGAENITVRTQSGDEYTAQLIGTDSKTDLAVIRVEATGLTPAVLADSENIQVGELAMAIGNPLGQLGGTVTSGIISAKGREITIDGESMNLLQTSAAVNPGNSGGGLFNAQGQLVGVVNAKSTGSGVEGLAFAIPANTVKHVADEIIANGYVSGRPVLGISVVEVNDARTAAMYRVNKAGVYVVESKAENSLQAGDRIAALGDTVIDGMTDISKELSQHAVGDTLSVVVERDGKQVRVDVVLNEQVPEQKQSNL